MARKSKKGFGNPARYSRNPKPHETRVLSTVAEQKMFPFARLYADMLQSKAWFDLSWHQQSLYMYMKLQEFRADKDKKSGCTLVPKSIDEEGNITEYYPPTYFFFNRSLYADRYHLYNRNDQKGFARDRDALVAHGFIEYISCGQTTQTKSVYMLSAKWWDWKEGEDFTPRETKERKVRNRKRYDESHPIADDES